MTAILAPSAPRRRYRAPSRLAEHVAPQLRMRPASVEQMIHGHSPIHHRFAVLVGGARALGELEMETRLMSPVEAALAQVPPRRLDEGDLLEEHFAADQNDDHWRVAYVNHRTTEARRQWCRALARFHTLNLQLMLALQAGD